MTHFDEIYDIFEPDEEASFEPNRYVVFIPEDAIWSEAKIHAAFNAYNRARVGIPPAPQDREVVEWAIEELNLPDPVTGSPIKDASNINVSRFAYLTWGGLFRGTREDESDGIHFLPEDLWESYCLGGSVRQMLDGDLVNWRHPKGGRGNWIPRETVIGWRAHT